MKLKCKYKYANTEIIRELEDGEKPKLSEYEFIDNKYLYRTVTTVDDGTLIDIRDKIENGEMFYVGIVVCSDGIMAIINLSDITVEL